MGYCDKHVLKLVELFLIEDIPMCWSSILTHSLPVI